MNTPIPLTVTGCTVVHPAAGISERRSLFTQDGDLCPESTARGSAVLDASGLYAIPGLIDMHVHATSDPSGRLHIRRTDLTPASMTLIAINNLGIALSSGVTTVRDLGAAGDLGYHLKSAWANGLFVGARPLVAGPVITALGGHGTWSGVESHGPEYVGGLVRMNLAKGSDVVKLMMRSAARRMELRPSEVREAIEEAHWLDVPVAIHANFSERSIDVAVESGCDTLEHGFAISPATAERMAEQGTALCATTVAFRSILDNPDAWIRSGGRDLVDRAAEQLPEAQASFQRALRAGVPLIAGTDAGVTGVTFDALGHELENMVELGASPHQALEAATSNAAKYLRRPDLGHLDTGAKADIVLLRGDPLMDITSCRSVEAVIQQGRVVRLDTPERLSSGEVSARPGSVLAPHAGKRR